MSKVIPGPKGRFLIGNLGQIDVSKVHVSFLNLRKEHGNIFQFRMFNQRIIVISDVAMMERAFSRQELCHRPADFFSHLKYDESGYLDSNFTEKDLALRSAVWKALSTIKGDAVMAKLREEELNTFLDSLATPSGVSIVESLAKSSARQYAIVLTGVEPSDQHNDAVMECVDSIKHLYDGGKLTVLTALPWLRYIPGKFKQATNRLIAARDQLAKTLVADARTHREQYQEHGVLQHMMTTAEQTEDAGNAITDENLIACTMDLLFNAVTPTSNFVAFSLLQAMKYPDMQQKIHAELGRISKEVKVVDIQPESTPYLEAFMMESMRYSSLVNLAKSHAVSEDTDVDGYLFPKGSIILGDLFSMHHDEGLWDDPWSFNPDRFLDHDGKSLPTTDPARKRVVHFGLGMRRCRGSTYATDHIYHYLVGVFSRYTVVPCEDSDLPSNDPLDYNIAVVVAVPEFKCKFQKK